MSAGGVQQPFVGDVPDVARFVFTRPGRNVADQLAKAPVGVVRPQFRKCLQQFLGYVGHGYLSLTRGNPVRTILGLTSITTTGTIVPGGAYRNTLIARVTP